jgi:hypothetical protein
MYPVWSKFIEGCYAVTIWPCDLDLWPWKSTGFQILLRTKYVPSLVKIHWRMLIYSVHKDVTDGRTDGSVTISFRNFVGEGIKSSSNDTSLNRKPLYEKYILISLYHVYVDNSNIVSIIVAPWTKNYVQNCWNVVKN